MDILSVPLEDVGKVAGSVGGGVGFMALVAKILNGNVRGVETRQRAVNTDLYQKLERQGAQLNAHELNDATNLAKRDELESLRDHIDVQFRDQRDFFMQLIGGMKQ